MNFTVKESETNEFHRQKSQINEFHCKNLKIMNFTADQIFQINEFDWEKFWNYEGNSLAHPLPLLSPLTIDLLSMGICAPWTQNLNCRP